MTLVSLVYFLEQASVLVEVSSNGLKKLRIEHPLSLRSVICSGGVAEWLGSGLQSRVRRFDSGPRLQGSHAYSGKSLIGYEHSGDWRSWLARLHDTQEVTGSIPVSPTTPSWSRAVWR